MGVDSLHLHNLVAYYRYKNGKYVVMLMIYCLTCISRGVLLCSLNHV